MPKYQIEANENLFHAWEKLSHDINPTFVFPAKNEGLKKLFDKQISN